MRNLFIHSYTQALSSRTAILQTLNRIINGVYFTKEPFEETADAWEGIPIIYSQEHPNMAALIENPQAELARIGGREVGSITNPRIELAGHPRLMADTNIYDPLVNDLIDKGKVSLSTGFYASDDRFKITGNVIPNHLLVFNESLFDQPRDLGSGFLNKNSTVTYIKELNWSDKRMADTPETKPPETLTAEQIANLKTIDVESFLNMQREMSAKLEQANAVINQHFTTIKAQEAKINAFAQMEKDNRWKLLEKKLPKGLVTGEETIKTREWLNKDPEGLLMHVIDHYENLTKELMTAQGNQFLNNIRTQQKKEIDTLCSGIVFHGEE